MILTTLRIGGRATFTCQDGFALKGDDDIECLSSGSWSSWPPTCVEIDCGQPDDIENGRIFLSNSSTNIGSVAEYHCFPGYDRSGPFERICLEDGYWSGREPSCLKPRPPDIAILGSDNTVDGTTNVRGALPNGEEDTSSVGMWIGVALGLIVVVGLIALALYFFRKQRAIAGKPPPYRDRNSNPVTGRPANVYNGGGPPMGINGGNGVTNNGNGTQGPALPSRIGIGQRPPPPIQMYSMEGAGDGAGPAAAAGGPIYDTINDDSSGGGGSVYSRSTGSDHYAPHSASTFNPHHNGFAGRVNGTGGGGGPGYPNGPPPQPPVPPIPKGGNEYDVPEGSDSGTVGGQSSSTSGTVTINGIAV